MDVDAHFSRGAGHRVCEDYALAGRGEQARAWALVCDGCSSSPHSDVGARLLAHAAALALQHGRLPALGRTIAAARTAAAALGLGDASLDATLLCALALDERVIVMLRGDGMIAARRCDGSIEVVARTIPDHTPDYPAMLCDRSRRATWLARSRPHAELARYDGRGWQRESVPGHAWFGRFDRRLYDRVAMASDGASSFRRRGAGAPAEVPLERVAAALLAAPSTTGCFVVRRVNRLEHADGPLGDVVHDDDLAVAALAWEPAP